LNPLHGDVSKLAMNVAMFGELLDVEFIQFIQFIQFILISSYFISMTQFVLSIGMFIG